MHEGRPIIESVRGGVMILCPVRHIVHHIRPGEWAGSIWEANASDPKWTVRCEGTLPSMRIVSDGPQSDCIIAAADTENAIHS